MGNMPSNKLISFEMREDGTIRFETDTYICESKIIEIADGIVTQEFGFYLDIERRRMYSSECYWLVKHSIGWVSSQVLELYNCQYSFPEIVKVK